MTPELPRAWLGYAPDRKRFCVVRVCVCCPDKTKAEELAARADLGVRLSICPECYERKISAMIGN
jgi:hypothetical protein